MVKSSLYGTMPLKQYRHILHPGSKLLIGESYEIVGHQETMKSDFNKDINTVREDYKISKVKHPHLLDQGKFVKMASTGPAENRHDEYLRKNPKIVKMAVLTIERYWKGYQCRKDFQNKMRIKQKLKEEELAEKLKIELELRAQLGIKKRRGTNNEESYRNNLDEPRSPIAEVLWKNAKKVAIAAQVPKALDFGPTYGAFSSYSGGLEANTSPTPPPQQHLPQATSRVQKIIMRASKNNNLSELEVLTYKLFPGDVNIIDVVGNTPLFYAAKYGNKNLCQFLLEKGAKVNTICQEGNTAMHMAFLAGSKEVIKNLIHRQ